MQGKPLIRLRANLRRSGGLGFQLTSLKGLTMRARLIELEAGDVFLTFLGAKGRLFGATQQAVFEHQHIHL